MKEVSLYLKVWDVSVSVWGQVYNLEPYYQYVWLSDTDKILAKDYEVVFGFEYDIVVKYARQYDLEKFLKKEGTIYCYDGVEVENTLEVGTVDELFKRAKETDYLTYDTYEGYKITIAWQVGKGWDVIYVEKDGETLWG